MDYEWNPHKARTNLAKHGVDFADAVTVLEDEKAITLEDDASDEERYITLGTDALGRILVVVYTWRGSTIRVISARKATALERQEYESE
jgi:hypothetical protein